MRTPTNRWLAFALLASAYFMTIIDLTIVNVSLPTIGSHLHFSASGLQWVITAYSLGFGGFLLLGGRAADLLGRRRVLIAGLALFTLASLGCGLAGSAAVLIATRALQGLGAAVMMPAALSIVMHTFPEGAERNKALAIWGALGATGATVGLITGGVLTRFAGWQYIFFLNVPIGLGVLALTPRLVPESRLDGVSRRFDLAGALSGTAGLVLLVDAISEAPRYGFGSVRTLVLLGVALVLLLGFVAIERRVSSPVLPLSIFGVRGILGANIAAMLLVASFYAFVFTGTLFMQNVLHWSALQSGVAWLTTSLTSVALAALAQVMVTRFGPRLVMAIGLACVGGGVVWATQIPVGGHYLANLAGPLAVAGAGTAFGFIPISIAALTGVDAGQAGVASGLLSSAQQLGGALGTAVAASVAIAHTHALLSAGRPAPVAAAAGFHVAFWVLGGVALAALPVIYALVARDDRPRHAEEFGGALALGETR